MTDPATCLFCDRRDGQVKVHGPRDARPEAFPLSYIHVAICRIIEGCAIMKAGTQLAAFVAYAKLHV